MKFSVPVACSSCGYDFSALGHAEERFPAAVCPKCGAQIHILDPLSISVVAERLLYRSQREITEGDYTLSIICSAIAVESALTQVFLKWKRIEHLKLESRQATDDEQDTWAQEYRKRTGGGFEKSANFVSEFLCGKIFDDFVANFLQRSSEIALIKAGFPLYESQLKASYIHQELFHRRNRIMHWGRVNYQQEDASLAFKAACSAFAVLKVIDTEKYQAMERTWRESLGQSPTAS
jgi:hypothetical protein